ncbi:MAG TPA: glycoside hydrolase family 88 protein, partial [Polyangiaceae bacterium]
DSLVTKFNPFKTNFVSAMTGGEAHVDRYIFGMVPIEIYLKTGDASYLSLGTQVADKQGKDQVRNAIDDMFMMPILQVQAYRGTKDDKYLKFMAPIMVQYLMAQKSNGLFNHNDAQGPVQWGRGNGWFAAGMAEMLKDLPTSSPQYATILAGYKKMMEGLLKVQGKNGLWYQVLDSTDSKNWEESSGSAMFTYAMIVGVRRGLLDAATYVPAIEAAWAGLQKKISAQGDVSDICEGTYFHATAQEYYVLNRLTGDGHGQAPVLWAAAELLRPN